MSSPYDALRELAGAATVLVVDDEPSVRQLIAVTLELEGHVVVQAADGRQALEIVAATTPDIITLDVMMPGLDGWDVADALDAHPRTAGIPRVMVSGKPLAELRAAPGSGRAAAVLSKPFDLVEFVDTIDRLLSDARPRAAQRSEASSPRLPVQRAPRTLAPTTR